MKKAWRSMLYAGVESFHLFDPKREICIGVNLLCVSICCINIVSGPVFYFLTGKKEIFIGTIAEIVLVLGVILLNYKKKYDAANLIFYIILNAATIYFSATLGKTAEVQLMILFLLGLIFFVFEKPAIRIVCVIITLLLLVGLEFNFKHPYVEPMHTTEKIGDLTRWLSYLVIISLVLLIFYLYNKKTKLLIQLNTYSTKIKSSLMTEERLNRMKNIIFQHIAHEIRGAYFAVAGICATLKYKIEEEEHVKRSLGPIARQLVSASDYYYYILNNFLEFSKFEDASLDSIHYEPVNLKKEIGQIIELNKYIAEQKNVVIKLVVEEQIAELVICDKLKIIRIVINLLSNAIKFTAENSVVVVKITDEGTYWKLYVQDQGKGISKENMDRIFEPFVSEKNNLNPQGVGLGLPITKYLTELINGEINVVSLPNVGTCFDIRVPYQMEAISLQTDFARL